MKHRPSPERCPTLRRSATGEVGLSGEEAGRDQHSVSLPPPLPRRVWLSASLALRPESSDIQAGGQDARPRTRLSAVADCCVCTTFHSIASAFRRLTMEPTQHVRPPGFCHCRSDCISLLDPVCNPSVTVACWKHICFHGTTQPSIPSGWINE